MDYYVTFNGSSVREHSYADALRMARRKSGEYGEAIIVCEEMQPTEYTPRPVATLLWSQTFTNGSLTKAEILNTRFSDVQGRHVPVEEWNREMENSRS